MLLMLAEPELGKVYEGKIMKIADFGAFVEIIPGIQGLMHVSQVDNKFVKNLEDIIKVGDVVKVKIIKLEGDKISLSRKVLLENKDEKKEEKKD